MKRSAILKLTAAGVALALAASQGEAQPPSELPFSEPELGLAGVRDVAPAGSPAQVPPLPPARRTFTPACGAEAPSPPRPPHNLLRWAFDADLGFPPGGFDLYRCCSLAVPPPPGASGWLKLNRARIRPPRTHAEGLAFVTGTGPMPDQGRSVLKPRLEAEEWAAFCRLLQEATGAPADCPPIPSPPPGPGATEMRIEPEALATLLLTSLRPEIAAMLGLSWVDDHGDAEGCFYRVEGFWDDGVRQALTGPVLPAVLPAPTGLSARQTPPESGLTCASLGGPTVRSPVSAALAFELRWDVPDPLLRPPAAESAVAYNICRQAPSETGFRQVNAKPYPAVVPTSLVEVPILVPRVPVLDDKGRPVLGASGEPETRLPRVFYEDRLGAQAVAGGTYGYSASALDVFGRESGPSAPAFRTLVDSVGPPPPVNLLAEVQAVSPPTTPPTARVILRFDWTAAQTELAPDAVEFRVYRRIDTPDLEVVSGCPVSPSSSGVWIQVGPPVPVSGWTARYTNPGELPAADVATFVDLVPLQRYQVVDTLALPTGSPMRNFFYRVAAFDARPNVGEPSGPALAWVVDNVPATPPDRLVALFSQSEWDDSVHVHLLWPPPSSLGNLAGYKLLRSVRAPACTMSAQCPAASCDENGCTPQDCTSGFCGGPDAGPADPHRQEDREATLTNGLDPFQPGPLPVEWAKLRSLAALGNLYVRDPVSGAPVLAAPGCRLPTPDPGCEGELQTAAGAGNTQYRQDTLPRKATIPVYFYRLMAVSQAGIQESGGVGSGSLSAAFPVQIPDFVAPTSPDLQSLLTVVSEDAVEIAWPLASEPDALVPGAGYTLLRAELEETPGPPKLAPNTGSYSPTGLADDHCYRFDVRPADATGAAAGPPVATRALVGSSTEEIDWPVVSGVSQVAIERREGTLAPVHTGRLVPGPAPQTVDGLKVTTDHFGAAIATLRVRDRPPEAERDYCYALRLADLAGNLSEPSRAQLGRRVDVVAPVPPDELRAERVLGEVQVRWSHAEAALRVTVKRSSVGSDGPWRTLAAAAEPREVAGESVPPAVLDTWSAGGVSEYRFRDLSVRPEQSYWYRIELHDGAGNKSGRNDGVVELEEEK